MTKAAAAPIHPKLAAIMVPRGRSRGKSRAATVIEAATAIVRDGAVQLSGNDPAELESIGREAHALATDPTKAAANAFSASHPEGTKALLARLLAEKDARVLAGTDPTSIILRGMPPLPALRLPEAPLARLLRPRGCGRCSARRAAASSE